MGMWVMELGLSEEVRHSGGILSMQRHRFGMPSHPLMPVCNLILSHNFLFRKSRQASNFGGRKRVSHARSPHRPEGPTYVSEGCSPSERAVPL